MIPLIVEFVVPGAPRGKQRPKARVLSCRGRGGRHKLQIYTPKETVAFEKTVALAAAVIYRGRTPDDGAVGLDVVGLWPWPKTITKKKRASVLVVDGFGLKTSLPDADNLVKAVADALEGIAYTMDGRVAVERCATLWHDGPACTVVRVHHGAAVFNLTPGPWWAGNLGA